MRSEPLAGLQHAAFELERGRQSVEHPQLLRMRRERVIVQVDEPGGDDEAACLERTRALDRRFRDHRDPAATNSDVAHAIETALRIDDAAAADDEIEPFVGAVRCGATDERQCRDKVRGDTGWLEHKSGDSAIGRSHPSGPRTCATEIQPHCAAAKIACRPEANARLRAYACISRGGMRLAWVSGAPQM